MEKPMNSDADRAARAPADSVTAPAATPTAASIAWTALRDLTDPLGEAGVKIMGHVRIYAQRQYEAGKEEADRAMRAQAAPAAVAGPSETPEGWRNQFAKAVYADLEAADNQDVPLEEYPTRILKALDSIVGPRHPTVIHWRNDAIQACIAIAYKYCRDPESFQYLKQDLQALIFAAPTTQAAQAADSVLENAARYHYLRDVPMAEWPDELATAFRMQQNAIWDAAIDAARKQGEKQ